MKPKKKVEIRPGCIVCKTCEFHAPDIFIVPEGALEAQVLNPFPDEGRLPDLHEAIRKCPEKIIKFRTINDRAENDQKKKGA